MTVPRGSHEPTPTSRSSPGGAPTSPPTVQRAPSRQTPAEPSPTAGPIDGLPAGGVLGTTRVRPGATGCDRVTKDHHGESSGSWLSRLLAWKSHRLARADARGRTRVRPTYLWLRPLQHGTQLRGEEFGIGDGFVAGVGAAVLGLAAAGV